MRPGDLDRHLFGAGRHERRWEGPGAHPYDGGTAFSVWAPNAQQVRLIGETTGWGADDGVDMVPLGSSGVW